MPLLAFAPPAVALSTAASQYALAWLVGRSAFSRIAGLHAIERATGSILLGLVAQAAIAFVLGCIGELQPTAFLTLVALAAAGSLWGSSRTPSMPAERNDAQRLPTWLWLALPIAFVPLVLAALQPPTFSDSGMYHLPLIQHFATSGHMTPATDQVLPVFALLFHLLATVPYQLGGETAVQLLHLGCFVLAGFVVLGAGHRLHAPHLGWLAASLWWGQPAFAGNATQALVDCAWPAFAAMALSLAMQTWQQTGPASTDSSAASTRPDVARPMLLAGLLGGAAGAIKYTGLMIALPLFLISTAISLRGHGKAILWCLLGGLLGAGPWLMWNYVQANDPLFPYLMALPENPYWTPADLRNQHATWSKHGAGHDLGDFLLLPVRLVTDSNTFLTGAPLSPFLMWLGLPFALFAAITTRAGRLLAVVTGVAVVVWFRQSQQLRFFSGTTLSLCWMTAVGVHQSRVFGDHARGRQRTLLLGIVCCSALPAYGTYRLIRDGMPVTTSAARDAVLLKRHATLPAHWWLAANMPHAKVYSLFGEQVRYAATSDRALTFTGSWFGHSRFEDIWDPINNCMRPAIDVANKLEQLGCSHLCITKTPHPDMRLEAFAPAYLMQSRSRWRLLRVDADSVLVAMTSLPTLPKLVRRELTTQPHVTASGATWVLSMPPESGSDCSMQFVDQDGAVLHTVQHASLSEGSLLLVGTAPKNTARIVLTGSLLAGAQLQELIHE